MKNLIEPIESKLPLATAFNRVISKLEPLRIMCYPRTFSDTKGDTAAFRKENFYETILWEQWLHGVFERLKEWENTINEYFDEFCGSWEYYALSKRLEIFNEFGSDDDEDFNPDGSFKTENITHEQLKYYTVFCDLYHDSIDIVQDTKAADLDSLISTLDANARISIIDFFQKIPGAKVNAYKMGDDGNFHPITFAEKELMKVSEMVNARDLGLLILTIAKIMESLISEISEYYESEKSFDNNHDFLNALLNDISKIQHLELNKTRFFNNMVPENNSVSQ